MLMFLSYLFNYKGMALLAGAVYATDDAKEMCH